MEGSLSEAPVVVVGAAILDGQPPGVRVLAAQRSEPPHLAGWWEFPGGKVEPGESEHDALVRECREELGLDVEVGERIGPEVLLPGGAMVLRVSLARRLEGDLRLVDHSDARWLAAAELHSVAWIEVDRPVVDALAALLGGSAPAAGVPR